MGNMKYNKVIDEINLFEYLNLIEWQLQAHVFTCASPLPLVPFLRSLCCRTRRKRDRQKRGGEGWRWEKREKESVKWKRGLSAHLPFLSYMSFPNTIFFTFLTLFLLLLQLPIPTLSTAWWPISLEFEIYIRTSTYARFEINEYFLFEFHNFRLLF